MVRSKFVGFSSQAPANFLSLKKKSLRIFLDYKMRLEDVGIYIYWV